MSEEKKRKPALNWILFIITLVVVFLVGMFTASIVERRAETTAKLQPETKIDEWEVDNSVWGKNYPREYDSYLKMKDTSFHSLFGGSARIDYLEEYPALVVLWAGYAFSKAYEQSRGHIYAVNDIRNILRTGGEKESPMPGTCWTCKGPDVPRMMSKIGVGQFYQSKWIDLGKEIVNPIGCLDCHDPKTMNLRISRPALIEAFERQGKKIEDFSHQDMRSLVCAQCHVEYYFQKGTNYLTFPWDKGFSVEQIEEYYDTLKFSDWTHKLSRAPMLKTQHPDYELFQTGVHYARGVACADCHMPYKVEGGIKYSDHHLQSPLNSISTTCQVCHRESEEQLRQDVYSRQQKIREIRALTEETLAKAHIEAKAAWDNGATEAEMAPVLTLLRHSQWRWDWIAASNSMGFHSPVEALRVLGTSIQKAEKARGIIATILVKHGVSLPIQYPDISTKEKAQKYVGWDMQSLKEDKTNLIKKIDKEWGKPILR